MVAEYLYVSLLPLTLSTPHIRHHFLVRIFVKFCSAVRIGRKTNMITLGTL